MVQYERLDKRRLMEGQMVQYERLDKRWWMGGYMMRG